MYSFDPKLAKDIGLEESIMMTHFQFWIVKNKTNNKHEYDGHTWTYNSVNAFELQFPFWTKNQISRILKSLEKKNVIKVGNYNKAKYDRTKWFCIIDEQRFLDLKNCNVANAEMQSGKTRNGMLQNQKPIPVTKAVTETDTKTIYKKAIDLFNQFCLKRFDAPAKIDGVQGKAMKSILSYLKKLCSQKGNNTPEDVLNALEFIFHRWDDLEPFLQKQVKLSQINSNLVNIINQLKNGSEQTQSSSSIAEDILAKYK